MALSRRLRRWLSGALSTAILFTQLALAAYVCPPLEAPDEHPPVAMAGMPDCHDSDAAPDPAQPQLCKAHCANEAQSAARSISADVQPNPASVALLQRVVEPPALAPLPVATARATPIVDPPGPLPLYLSLLVLRN